MNLNNSTIDTVNLVRILGRSNKGVSQPFIVSCDDGCCYYAKGPKMIGYTAICSEFIASLIALEWKLPIPQCKLIRVSDDFIKLGERDDLAELSGSILWGVEEIQSAIDYVELMKNEVDEELRRKIILFDWFIKNEDRKTGNSNLLWQVVTKKLFVIDHNNAFDDQFDNKAFWKYHVFNDEKSVIFKEEFYKQFIQLMQKTNDNLDRYFELLPIEWIDNEFFISYRQRVESYLTEPFKQPNEFWSTL